MDHLLKQRLTLIKRNGTIVHDIPASVQDRIYINDLRIPVEEGDVLSYKLPSELERRLLVTKMVVYNLDSSLDHMELEYVVE